MRVTKLQEYLEFMKHKHGLTVRDISKRGGVSHATIREMARRERPNPCLQTIKGLAMGMGVSEAEVAGLFGLQVSSSSPTIVALPDSEPPMTRNEHRVIEAELALHLLLEQNMGNVEDAELVDRIGQVKTELHDAVLAVIKERGIKLPEQKQADPGEDILDAEYIIEE